MEYDGLIVGVNDGCCDGNSVGNEVGDSDGFIVGLYGNKRNQQQMTTSAKHVGTNKE